MTFPKDLVRQNDMVYAKIQLLLSLLRSINLTFQNQRDSLFSQKNGEVKIFGKRLQKTANLQETANHYTSQLKHSSSLNDNTFFDGESKNAD